MNKQFEDVRNWGEKRGLGESNFQAQYQRVLQEIVEIHEAFIDDDMAEVSDAIGDSLVTLINLAKTVEMNAEDCLEGAFGVIELRKGLTKKGSFVRYGKLSDEDKLVCDEKQGNPGDQYYIREHGENLTPYNFTPKA
jgi:uncharacterized protein YabN with tetrapyrrole methylase and pyrophosphatase domain